MSEPRFAFVIHPLAPWQRRLLGIRHRDLALLRQRESDRVRKVATLCIDTRSGPVTGLILSVPDLPEDLVTDQQRAVELQIRAVQLASELGATAVGLGSALAVVGGRGEVAAESVRIPVTTGHASTAWACAQLALQVSGAEPVGVLGFRGTVGDAIAGVLAPEREVLVEARGTADARRAKALGVTPVATDELLSRCRVVVGASTTGPSLDPSALRPGTTLLDLANPLTLRPGESPSGTVVLAGETLAWPGRVHGRFWGRIWRLVAAYEGGLAYACLAEPLMMAATGQPSPSLGRRLDPDAVHRCGEALTALGFSPTLHRRRSWPTSRSLRP